MKFGGTLIGIHESLNPILIKEYSDTFELLVTELTIGSKDIRLISGYGPQDCWKIEDRMPFFTALEEEISKAEISGKSIVISFDANSKLGPDWIPKDPHEQSPNGQILAGVLERHALFVANGDKEKCQGTITRRRTTVDGEEISAIDFVILSHDMVGDFVSLQVDEAQKYSLTSVARTKKGTKCKESDHNSLITKFKIKYDPHIKKHRTEIFIFKDSRGQTTFKDKTSNTAKLSSIIENTIDINNATKKFIKKTF